MRSSSFYRSAFVALALASASGMACADTTVGTGLGQSWPNAQDVSANPNFHVYRFERGGVHYVQVNDAAGTVRGAIGTIGGEIFELPVGVDASRWSKSTQGTHAGDVVYRDTAITVSIVPQPDGSARLMADQVECKNDPITCGTKGP
ncbi:MAG: hypothetical protein GAK28_01873 [Luteibacter sp.]|uniref:hypothetical protein n=1 Tax=Luteibacter sp. TaxID=1886636 RepID=UPI001384CFC8|nr:hypothetical protein [Luteibacter sp.]KAF1007234.1 MAG: hypothetical protein GAK28_01873 [Luteibacter sp.]